MVGLMVGITAGRSASLQVRPAAAGCRRPLLDLAESEGTAKRRRGYSLSNIVIDDIKVY